MSLRALIVIMALLPSTAVAGLELGLITWTAHYENHSQLNNDNYGLAISYSSHEYLVGAGFYRNSFRRHSNFAFVGRRAGNGSFGVLTADGYEFMKPVVSPYLGLHTGGLVNISMTPATVTIVLSTELW